MFFDVFEQLCKENKTTPTAVLQSLGVSIGNMHRWKQGINPGGPMLKKIADRFNVSADYLLGIDDIKKRSASEGEERIIKAMQESPILKALAEEFQELSPDSQAKAVDFLALLKRAENNKAP